MSKTRVPAPQLDRHPQRVLTLAEKSTRFHRPQDGYAPPDPEDRREAELLAEARERGFRLAVQRTRCGHWLVSERSVTLHLGPSCRAKGEGR